MSSMTKSLAYIGALVVCFAALPGSAIFAADLPQELLGKLQLPCSIAVRPESGQPGEIFVADRGAGRILRLNPNQPDHSSTAISGFPVDAADPASVNAAGIQSIYFLDHMRLTVAGGGADGNFFVRAYELVDADTQLRFDDQRQSADLPEKSDSHTSAIRTFHDIARTRPNERVPDSLLLAAVSQDGPAGLWRVPIRANTIGNIEPLDENGDLDQLTAIGGLAVSPAGYIAAAIDPKEDDAKRTELAFLNPVSGETLLKLKTDLPRIVALAYQPSTGDLFAACATTRQASADGIYRLDDHSQSGTRTCRATKVADIKRPTAIAFAADGTLYITALGPRDGNNTPSGTLLRVPAATPQQ